MKSERITIIVEVNTDPVPGWGNDPNDFVKMLQHDLDARIPHYNPVVTLSQSFSDGTKDQEVAPSSS